MTSEEKGAAVLRPSMKSLCHHGGIHSRCGIAVVMISSLFNGAIMKIRGNLKDKGIRAGSFLITVASDVLLLDIPVFPHPKLRAVPQYLGANAHLAGWKGLGMF